MNIILINCNIVDVNKGTILRNQCLKIESKKITKIIDNNTQSNGFDPKNFLTINIKNQFVLPGLIDSHVHIFYEGNPKLYKNFKYDEDIFYSAFRCAKNLSEAINSGVTYLRDVGSVNRRNNLVRNIIKENIYKGPDIISCGNLISSKK